MNDRVKRRCIEDRFAKNFIPPYRRERFIELAGSRDLPPQLTRNAVKKRAKYCSMLERLANTCFFERRAMRYLAAGLRAERFSRLVSHGVIGSCYVLSEHPDFDGRVLTWQEAIDAVKSTAADLLVNKVTFFVDSGGESAYCLRDEIHQLSRYRVPQAGLPLSESDYWLILMFQICGELNGIEESRRLGLWCDGIDPQEYSLATKPAWIAGRIWIAFGEGRHEAWSFTLFLPRVGSREEIDWSKLYPPDEMTGWLRLDFRDKCVEIDPAAAEPVDE